MIDKDFETSKRVLGETGVILKDALVISRDERLIVDAVAEALRIARQEGREEKRHDVEASITDLSRNVHALTEQFIENLSSKLLQGDDPAPGFCPDCLNNGLSPEESKQRRTGSGLVCKAGHGGADPVYPCAHCGQPETKHASDCLSLSGTQMCPGCHQTMSWSPSGYYCGDEACPKFQDTPAF